MTQAKTKARRTSGSPRPETQAATHPAAEAGTAEAERTEARHRIFEHQQVVEPVEVTLATPMVRFGLASLLIVNALAALVDPDGFELLITGNILGEALPSVAVRASVMLVATNDLALGAALISGWRPQIVYRWLALWFFAIASLKLLSFL